MSKKGQSNQNQFIVQKRNGRLEPFDDNKMSIAVSRAGTPFVMARDIAAAAAAAAAAAILSLFSGIACKYFVNLGNIRFLIYVIYIL
jgi:hypothetical protein